MLSGNNDSGLVVQWYCCYYKHGGKKPALYLVMGTDCGTAKRLLLLLQNVRLGSFGEMWA